MATTKSSLDPRKTPDEVFDLFSIPAFDAGTPEVIRGAEIGSAKQALLPGDVLLSKIVPHIRRACVVPSTAMRRMIGSGEWIIFRSPRFDPAYLRHALVSDQVHRAFMQTVAGVGGSLLRARPSYVAEIEIPLPSIEEQRRIASILDAADALRTKRRQALAKLDTLTQAIFVDMFGSPSSNRDGSPVVELGELMPTDKSSVDPRKTPEQEFDLISIPAFDVGRPEIIRGAEIGSSKQVLLSGDVLLSKIVPHIRRACVVHPSSPRPMIGSGEWIIFRSTRFDPAYLRTALVSDGFHSAFMQTVAGVGGSLLRARPSHVAKIKIPLPALSAQRRFAAVDERLQRETRTLRESARHLEDLFYGLQHRAFRGEL